MGNSYDLNFRRELFVNDYKWKVAEEEPACAE